MENRLEKMINQFAFPDGNIRKLKCKDAFEIAEKIGVPIRSVGNYCNRNHIKIASCQLGCFK